MLIYHWTDNYFIKTFKTQQCAVLWWYHVYTINKLPSIKVQYAMNSLQISVVFTACNYQKVINSPNTIDNNMSTPTHATLKLILIIN